VFSSCGYWDGFHVFDVNWVITATGGGDARGTGEDAAGFVYGTGQVNVSGAAHGVVTRWDKTNTLLHQWLISSFASGPDANGFRDTIGINDTGTLAYNGRIGGDTIWVYDLVADPGPATGAFNIFTTETGSVTGENSIKVLPTGDVLVGWGIGGTSSYVKRYSPAGATLATYTLPSGFGRIECVALSVDKLSFWANYHVIASYGIAFAHVRISDGALLHSFTPADTGFEWDGPFCVTNTRDCSEPSARLSVPVLSYTPYTTVLRSPTLRRP